MSWFWSPRLRSGLSCWLPSGLISWCWSRRMWCWLESGSSCWIPSGLMSWFWSPRMPSWLMSWFPSGLRSWFWSWVSRRTNDQETNNSVSETVQENNPHTSQIAILTPHTQATHHCHQWSKLGLNNDLHHHLLFESKSLHHHTFQSTWQHHLTSYSIHIHQNNPCLECSHNVHSHRLGNQCLCHCTQRKQHSQQQCCNRHLWKLDVELDEELAE